jgi:ABC-type nitrate/sulfonate/bicarbonate transport system substrate-binding protein
MSEQKKTQATIQLTRRAFLKYTSAGVIFPTVLGIVPDPVKGNVYAQSEKNISADWLELANKYGEPTGKFGKIGEPVTLTIGYQPYCTPYWTATLNKQAKIFTQYLPKGSKVVWFRALSGPLINNNMYSGKNQFGYMAETPALSAGDLVKCDMVSATGYDVGEVGSLCVPTPLIKGGKIKTPQDLAGKNAAVPFGSFAHRQILTWMEQNNVELNLSNRSVEQIVASLRTKKTWLANTWAPYPLWLEKQGIATRWLTGQDMPCSCEKHFPEAEKHTFRVVGSVLAIHDWLCERPDIMAAYLKSEEECRDLLTHDPDLAAYYIWTDIPEIPPEIVRTTLDMMVWDGRITPEVQQHLKGCARMWRQAEFLKKARSEQPDQYVEEWADDKFLRLALKELQAEGWWTSEVLPGFPKEIRPDQLNRHSWETYKDLKLKKKDWQRTKV